MRSFKEYIREELADSLNPKNAVEYKIVKKNKEYTEASFEIEGEKFTYVFLFRLKDEMNGVYGTFYGIEFFNQKKGYGVTGTGNVHKVFATVFKLLKESIKYYDPDVIFFDKAEGRSRGPLYKRFLKEVEKLLPGYEGKVLDHYEYSIVKKEYKEKVEEKGEKDE